MKQLKVLLFYSASAPSHASNGRGTPLALPLRVLDDEGGLIAVGAASNVLPAYFDIPDSIETVFVRLTWPSDKTQTQRVNFEGRDSADVTFTDSSISQNEWSAWAVPRLNPRSALVRSSASSDVSATPESPGAGLGRYDRVWLRLWRWSGSAWNLARLDPTAQFRSTMVRQIDYQLEARPWMLQVGGSDVPWRLVSLPGGGTCRILLTPNGSTDPRSDALKIVVTGFRSDAETLLEFLSRDALRSASYLATYQPLAVELVEYKESDPIAAIAGAYFLLRTKGWSSVPLHWFDNLQNLYAWIPDASIIRCVVMIRAGLRQQDDVIKARCLLEECLLHGLPVYAEGLSLLQEAASILRTGDRVGKDDVLLRIERLATASAWAGSALSFYGASPNEPSPEKIVGMPNSPRRLKRSSSSKSTRGNPKISGRTKDESSPRAPKRSMATASLLQADETATQFARVVSGDVASNKQLADELGLLFLGDIGDDAAAPGSMQPMVAS